MLDASDELYKKKGRGVKSSGLSVARCERIKFGVLSVLSVLFCWLAWR